MCAAANGARLLRQWLKQPLLNIEQLRTWPCTLPLPLLIRVSVGVRQDTVCSLLSDSELCNSLHTSLLRRVPDFPRLCSRFQQGKATLAGT